MGLIPGITLVIAAMILFAFPLRGDRLKKIKTEILRMHNEKQEKLEELENKA
jgi:Na+/melibiose symporter-like transporter